MTDYISLDELKAQRADSIEGPQPLVREVPKGDEYPVEALGPLKAAVQGVADITGAPIALAAQSALSTASLALQAHGNTETLGSVSPLSLFCLSIAGSGERKSTVDRHFFAGVIEYERARSVKYEAKFADWGIAHRIWTARRDHLVKRVASSTKDKSIAARSDLSGLEPEPPQPLAPNLTASEPTLEGLVKLYIVGSPYLGIFSDEGGGFFGGHAMNADNRLKTIAGLSSLWDGSPVNRTRAGDGARTLYGRRLASHFMAQPVAALVLLADPLASDQGFLARFLMTEPASTIGRRLNRTTDPRSKAAEVAFKERLLEILNQPLPTKQDRRQELDPPTLQLSERARNLLWAYYKEIEKLQSKGERLELVRPYASKSPEQACRIAAVMTLWSDLDATEVSMDTMADAIDLASYYLTEAQRLVGAAVISQEIDKAEKLRRWLIETWPPKAASLDRDANTVLPRDILNSGPNSLRDSKKLKPAIALLVEHGWLVKMDEGSVVDGASRKLAYRIITGGDDAV